MSPRLIQQTPSQSCRNQCRSYFKADTDGPSPATTADAAAATARDSTTAANVTWLRWLLERPCPLTSHRFATIWGNSQLSRHRRLSFVEVFWVYPRSSASTATISHAFSLVGSGNTDCELGAWIAVMVLQMQRTSMILDTLRFPRSSGSETFTSLYHVALHFAVFIFALRSKPRREQKPPEPVQAWTWHLENEKVIRTDGSTHNP